MSEALLAVITNWPDSMELQPCTMDAQSIKMGITHTLQLMAMLAVQPLYSINQHTCIALMVDWYVKCSPIDGKLASKWRRGAGMYLKLIMTLALYYIECRKSDWITNQWYWEKTWKVQSSRTTVVGFGHKKERLDWCRVIEPCPSLREQDALHREGDKKCARK